MATLAASQTLYADLNGLYSVALLECTLSLVIAPIRVFVRSVFASPSEICGTCLGEANLWGRNSGSGDSFYPLHPGPVEPVWVMQASVDGIRDLATSFALSERDLWNLFG